MNKHLLTLLTTLALVVAARAESSVKLSGVHLCCKSCVTGAEKAVTKVSGALIELGAAYESQGTVYFQAPAAMRRPDSAAADFASATRKSMLTRVLPVRFTKLP